MLPSKEFFEGVALKKCVTATYNHMQVMLAPHVLYTRHDEMHVDAVTIEREGQPPRELKLGTFKLSGLKDVVVEDRQFEPYDIFDAAAEKYQGTTLMMVEP
ncbi:hypothetical protein [Parasphingorhabdus sp.]|uniref:hypothetical protein n=1 Tax=Parasphingorhabdus sp. TaxID=2709688 RepID=UPI003BAF37DA